MTRQELAFYALVAGMVALLMLAVGLVVERVFPGLDNAKLIERWVG